MTVALLIIFGLSSLVLLWMFAGYPLTLFVLTRLHPNPIVKSPLILKVTILICTYNEVEVIKRRIENLLESDYPLDQMEILVVDSASPDGTVNLVEQICTAHPSASIRLVRENKRRGKVSAINIGLSHAKGEIVILTDGPAIFWPDTIRLVVENFSDPRVGVVTGNFVDYPNSVETSAQKNDQLMFRFRKLLRRLESEVDSTPWLSGELLAFRKTLLPAIPPEVIIDDSYIALYMRSQGYRVVADFRAKYAEKRSKSHKEMITQKVKSVAGDIPEMIRFGNMCFNHRYGAYGLLIFPTVVVLHLHFSPIVFGLAMCSGVLLVTVWLGVQLSLLLFACVGFLAFVLSFFRQGMLLRPLIVFVLAEWIISSKD